ncbi:hypothetical protein TELCIR_24412, partial [Teladorsagia circumcincta]
KYHHEIREHDEEKEKPAKVHRERYPRKRYEKREHEREEEPIEIHREKLRKKYQKPEHEEEEQLEKIHQGRYYRKHYEKEEYDEEREKPVGILRGSKRRQLYGKREHIRVKEHPKEIHEDEWHDSHATAHA